MRIVAPSAPLMVAAVLALSASHVVWAEETSRSFEIYGFAQADWIQDTKRVNPSWMDAFRPSKIANPEGEFGTNGQSDISVKQSRFGVKGTLPTGDHSPPVSFKFEIDMFGVGVDAGQTTIRLRHAYGEWGQLLAGQTHSLFMDIDVFPDVIDYWGPPGMVFNRDPQIRWTAYRTQNDAIAFAIERPSNDVDAGNIRTIPGYEGFSASGNQPWPDLTGQFRHDDSWGHYQIAAILRDIGYNYQVTALEPTQKGSKTGWGVNLSGVYNTFGKDKVLLQVVYGDGLGTYMNDGGMDLAPNAANNPLAPVPTLSAEAVPLTGVSAYYGHYWTPEWESSIGYSFTQVTNTNFQAAGTFHKGQYASGNLIWYPADKVMIGAELMWGQLTDNNNTVGIDWRFQFSVKYNFGTKL